MQGADVAVVGGGMIGSAIAYGLARLGAQVVQLDEGDRAFRAARGNFGLIWVQSKGLGCPAYAAWTQRSAAVWGEFALHLRESLGIDVQHRRPGGVHLCLSDAEMEARALMMRRLHNQMPALGAYRMIDRKEAEALVPGLGPRVRGGSYSPLDGEANPLMLLRALHSGINKAGGIYVPGAAATAIEPTPAGFRIAAGGTTLTASKLVLAAGLGNAKLAPMVGLRAPVQPLRGQILVTERARPFLDIPTTSVRQTGEGSLMIGDSHEDVGFDDGTTLEAAGAIAARATAVFPALADLQVVRTWGALRVMSPDGLPIYDQSVLCPGAFLATAHSGVTLAGAHATDFAGWVAAGALPPEMAALSAARFDVDAPRPPAR